MSEELQQKLRDQLWEVANKLRGNMSASDFMYFTLGFIFYKYLSEKIEKHANDALVDDEVTFKELWAMEKDEDIEELQEVVKTECLENIGYFIEPNFLFSSVIESIKRKENILPMLERSLKRIEDSTLGQDSEEDFGGLFSDIDLASPKLGKTADDKNTLVSNVLLALDDIDFGVEASQEIDILGDAYEYMISQFAAGAGKKAGEFYTPQEVSRILAEIVTIGHARLRNVYDPTCGSGSLLLRAASIGHANEIFGQEKNPTTYNLARMNMLLHGIKFSNFRIENGDTLEADAFGDTQFDAVVAAAGVLQGHLPHGSPHRRDVQCLLQPCGALPEAQRPQTDILDAQLQVQHPAVVYGPAAGGVVVQAPVPCHGFHRVREVKVIRQPLRVVALGGRPRGTQLIAVELFRDEIGRAHV